MASERPPREYLPIFNPLQYEGSGLRALAGGSDTSPNKLDFPEAQNTEAFPDGIVFGLDAPQTDPPTIHETSQKETFTGALDVSGTYTNASIRLDENGKIIKLYGGQEQSKYTSEWDLNNVTIESHPATVNFQTTVNPGKVTAEATGTAQTSEATFNLPSTANFTDGTTTVTNPTLVRFTGAAEIVQDNTQCDITLNTEPDIRGSGVNIVSPDKLNFTGDVAVNGSAGTTATVTPGAHSNKYVRGQGNTYRWTSVSNFNRQPSKDNTIFTDTGNNIGTSQWAIQIPIFQVDAFYQAGAPYPYPVSGMALNTTLTCELIDNLILQRANMGTSAATSSMEYFDNNMYMGQMAFQPGALIANWAWGQFNSNIPGFSNTPGIWPLTNTTYTPAATSYPFNNSLVPGLGAPYYATCLNNTTTEIRPGPTVPGYLYTAPRGSPYWISNYQNFQAPANGTVWPGWWAQNISNSVMLGSGSNSPYPWGGVQTTYGTQTQDPPNFSQNQFTWTVNVISESNFAGYNAGAAIGGGAKYLGGAPNTLTIPDNSGLSYSGRVVEIKCQNPIMGISDWQNGDPTRVYSTKRFQTVHLTGGYNNGNCPYCRVKLFNGGDTQYQELHDKLYPDSPADFDYLDLGSWAIRLTQVQM
ncbi:MAG: hypothetical protein ACPHF2_06960 [Crocinitomicaceae bacterium]